MPIKLSHVVTDITVNDSDREKIELRWNDFFLRLRGTDDDNTLSEELGKIEGRIKTILDSTENGRKYFGQTACAIYLQRKQLNAEVLEAATFNSDGLEIFADLVKAVSADARQAFNDYSGALGVQGN